MSDQKTLTLAEIKSRPLLGVNLRALEQAGADLFLDWLGLEREYSALAEVTAENGQAVVVVSGQSQASRRDPRQDAERWLARQRESGLLDGGGEDLLLFGLGSPWPAALILAESRKRLLLYEPDPAVLLAVLSRRDFSRELADGRLKMLSPWHLAKGLKLPAGILVHPPAQRRQAGSLMLLRRLAGEKIRDLAALKRPPRLMIVPPLSGGSWPVAVSLARAAEGAAYETLFLDWDEDLRRLENEARRNGGAQLNKLFEKTGRLAAGEAAAFQPDLILALAQAPLDGPALTRLRDQGPAPLVFWLVEDFRYFSYVAELAPAYDLLFHIQEGLIEKSLRDWGLARAHYLPLAADPGLFRPDLSVPPEFQADLSFMGAGYPNRRRLLSRLAEDYWPRSGRAAEAFKVFGSGWAGADPALKKRLFEGGRRVSLAECALIYAGGRVNLNLHSSFSSRAELNPESRFVNPRTFELAAAGALQLVDERPLLAPLFSEGRELAVFRDYRELPDMIDHYLNNPEAGREMGQAARARVLKEHSYRHRLAAILNCLAYSGTGEVQEPAGL
ncbi:MAG: glycosyltransferase [Candidatus Adiutrix sp.]|nr:glycosyltransferase [Candidatus Adiutrix sp.]